MTTVPAQSATTTDADPQLLAAELGSASSGGLAFSDDNAAPEDIAPAEPLVTLAPCDADSVALLRGELEIGDIAAQTLVRRGLADPGSARAFLDDGQLLPATALPGATRAAAVIAQHVRSGDRIAVHGDYDVDGVCSTAILVRTLARVGAEVTWHVPSRFKDGYGLSRSSIDRLAADGVSLIVAVDCGITAVDEVEHARTLGVEVVVCDHHTPGETLPDAPIVHPALGDYPCPALCATTVVFKLAQLVVAELGADIDVEADEIELTALATVCDVVPLTGENRAIVRAGLNAMRTTTRPGLRELMRAAGIDPLNLDATSFGFRLGPRINAAGRMFSAEPAVELLLTQDERRAVELATELNSANARRKDAEQAVLMQAEQQARMQRDQFAIVVSGESWHPGVLGIVAGRIAEQYRRPCVALGIDGGVAAGSGRGGGVYDLLAGLNACSDRLIRYGGHKAAAGLELDESSLAAFTREFQAHAAAVLTADDLRPHIDVDAIVRPSQLTLASAEELLRLGPFGNSNPEPALLVPAVSVSHLRKMGSSGAHFKLSIEADGGRAGVVAFGWKRQISHGDDAPLSNIVVRLRPNEFRGVVEGQSQLVAHVELPATVQSEVATQTWIEEFNTALAQIPPHVELGGTFDLHGIHARALDREDVVAAYRVLRETSGEPFKTVCAALATVLPSPFKAALALKVLDELQLVGVEYDGDSVESMVVTQATKTELERSETYRSYSDLKDQSHRWHARSTPTPQPLRT